MCVTGELEHYLGKLQIVVTKPDEITEKYLFAGKTRGFNLL